MNRSKLISNLIERNQFLSKSDVEESVSLILYSLSNTLSQEGRVELRGFGSFSTRKRNKRISRNPKTGRSISVQEKRHPYFRASKRLKEAINN
jgi:integration host factor subunit beta